MLRFGDPGPLLQNVETPNSFLFGIGPLNLLARAVNVDRLYPVASAARYDGVIDHAWNMARAGQACTYP